MQKKITVAISIVALCVTFFSGTAQAITGITSSITTNMNGTPSLFVNPYEDFSITFTAQNLFTQEDLLLDIEASSCYEISIRACNGNYYAVGVKMEALI